MILGKFSSSNFPEKAERPEFNSPRPSRWPDEPTILSGYQIQAVINHKEEKLAAKSKKNNKKHTAVAYRPSSEKEAQTKPSLWEKIHHSFTNKFSSNKQKKELEEIKNFEEYRVNNPSHIDTSVFASSNEN